MNPDESQPANSEAQTNSFESVPEVSQQPTPPPAQGDPEIMTPQPQPQPQLEVAPQPQTPPQAVQPQMQAGQPEVLAQQAQSTAVPTEAEPASVPTEGADEPIHWQAAERVDSYRSPVWYIFFLITSLGLTAFAIFVVKSITFAVLVVVMAVAFVAYTRRPPQSVPYALSRKGLYVGERLYGFSEFRGFSIVREDGRNTLTMVPVKRFRLGVEAEIPDEVGEAVVDTLAARLPMHTIKLSPLEKIARKLRL